MKLRTSGSLLVWIATLVPITMGVILAACDQAPEPTTESSDTASQELSYPRPICPPCPRGTRCEVEEVVCVRAPCPPIVRCVPIVPPPPPAECKFPGRCAVTLCREGTTCVLGPSPLCQPRCVPTVPPGEPCGENVCGAGQYCCNPSCGICAPKGGACTQQVCESPASM